MPPGSSALVVASGEILAPPPTSMQQLKIRRRSEVITCFRVDDSAVDARNAAIAAEVPIALAYNGVSHVVMMATPSNLADFALGFSVSEGILTDPAELLDLRIEEGQTGIRISMTITRERFTGLKTRRRNLTGRTGCGICGVDDLTQVARPLPRVGTGARIGVRAIHQALNALPGWQPANKETGAVHAAAWASPTGKIAVVREDVGRHNALDKLIGAIEQAKIDPESGFVVITSRCSFEMVQKAATMRIPILVAISAPTTMALRIAEHTGMTLVALARSDSITVYTSPGRIKGLLVGLDDD